MPKLLIVDDEEDQEEIILQRFSNKPYLKGYQFLFARNGLEGLRFIEENQDIDIALVDINMPKMDGLTMLQKMKDVSPITQAVILSAYDDMSNIRSAMNKGAFDFITKPIDLEDLDLTLQKTILHVRNIRENIRVEEENQRLKEKSMELEMKALRAQMNPHFIFNALSSINNLILKDQKDVASEYLLKFSRLTRFILENSKNNLIPVEQEIEALKLYIDLESVRFLHRFEYQVDFNKDLDIDSILVPPLILQPYVENAIHHGLLQKAAPGTLLIQLHENEGRLLVKITDDGIGRIQAAEIAHGKPLRHRPMGMDVTRERLELLQNYSGMKPNVVIRDLTSSSGEPAGTEVLISIPIIT